MLHEREPLTRLYEGASAAALVIVSNGDAAINITLKNDTGTFLGISDKNSIERVDLQGWYFLYRVRCQKFKRDDFLIIEFHRVKIEFMIMNRSVYICINL